MSKKTTIKDKIPNATEKPRQEIEPTEAPKLPRDETVEGKENQEARESTQGKHSTVEDPPSEIVDDLDTIGVLRGDSIENSEILDEEDSEYSYEEPEEVGDDLDLMILDKPKGKREIDDVSIRVYEEQDDETYRYLLGLFILPVSLFILVVGIFGLVINANNLMLIPMITYLLITMIGAGILRYYKVNIHDRLYNSGTDTIGYHSLIVTWMKEDDEGRAKAIELEIEREDDKEYEYYQIFLNGESKGYVEMRLMDDKKLVLAYGEDIDSRYDVLQAKRISEVNIEVEALIDLSKHKISRKVWNKEGNN